MKKVISIILACAFTTISVLAQQAQTIPVDPQVRIGKLDNGLTYYIRHNEEPKGQANFYIAQKVGSILEDDSQRGLAHFLEHMCFNGTEKFPGNGVIKYCESIGVKFGTDLNAYTSIDETVYNIDNVPVATTPSAIDSCLWILHDWADGLLLEDDDIDHERGVIHEEWRTRMNAQMRQYEKILPALYPDNKYGVRLPIGIMEVVDNFPYQVLRDYYEKWYRPDQQGIVVVGDIDVDAVEAKIKDIFGTIATPVDPAVREYVQIADNEEPIVVMATDKEQPYAITYIFAKHDAFPDELKTTMNYLIYNYALEMATDMLNERLQEILQSPGAPFVMAQAAAEDDFFIAKTKKSFEGICVTPEDKLVEGATAIYREMLRAQRGGFTESEYERARAEYLNNMESAYNQREKIKSAEFCKQYVRHFIDNEPIPGIENGYMLATQLAPMIPVEVINQLVATLAAENNLAVACMLPEKEGAVYPSEAELAAAFKAVAAEDIEPYQEEVSNEPLISELPVAGKVVKSNLDKFGYMKYVLSNGATVYLKQTDLNPDQILFRAVSDGGFSVMDSKDLLEIKTLGETMNLGGLGNFSRTALNKALAGKKANIRAMVSQYNETVSGNTTPKDFETMMQLIYLNFTARRADQDAFDSWKNQAKTQLKNQEQNPMAAFQDSIFSYVYNNPEYVLTIKADDVDKIDYARALELANERFANAADFTFFFTGAIDPYTALPLIEQYIGSLPATGKKEKANAKFLTYRGPVNYTFKRKMEVPNATVGFVDNAKMKYSLKNDLAYDMAMRTLTIVLLEEIREKEGGTYGISSDGALSDFPRKEGFYQIVYQTNPERAEYLNGRIMDILADFSANGPSEENIAKAKEYLSKSYQENLRENSYWQRIAGNWFLYGTDLYTDYKKTLESITAKDIQKAFNAVYKKGNLKTVMMMGE